MVKNLPAHAGDTEMQVQSLEQEMVTHSSILAWKIPWRSLVGYSPHTRLSEHVCAHACTHTHLQSNLTNKSVKKSIFISNAYKGVQT